MLARILYTFMLVLASPLLLYKLYQKKDGKPTFGKRWVEHFGFVRPLKNKETAPIWIHAVSVGESIAIMPLVKKLKAQHPTIPIVITTTTSTGAQQIKKMDDIVEHRFMPIDFAWCVRGFIKQIKPQVMLIVETELWPNTLSTVHKNNIPIIIVNARLSSRSADRYKKFNFVWKLIASNIDHFLCLHEDDASRFIGLGISKEKITVTGSLKYDITIPESVMLASTKLRNFLGEKRPTVIAASTHRGEDELVLAAFKNLKSSHPTALLILVPRHPERFSEVEELCKQANCPVVRRTTNKHVESHVDIYLADTMGEMLTLMAAADITFMGGSLLGDKVGGHNFIEPAALQKAIITGPSFYNFSDLAEQLLAQKALIVCTAETLADNLSHLLSEKSQAQAMGNNAQKVVLKNQGALQASLNIISHYLTKPESL